MRTANFRIEQDESLLMCVWVDVVDESGHDTHGLGRFALLANAHACVASVSSFCSQRGYKVSVENKVAE